MKIVQNKNFGIYIYPNDHPPPHCHVRFNDGSEVSVDIPLIVPRYGATISKQAEKKIRDSLEKLGNAWEKLNKPKQSENKKKN